MKWTHTKRSGGEWYFDEEIVFHPVGTEDFENFAVMPSVNEQYASLISEAPALLEALEQILAWKEAVQMIAPELGGLLKSFYAAEHIVSKAKGGK